MITKNPKKNKFSEKFKKLLRKIIDKTRIMKIKFMAQYIENWSIVKILSTNITKEEAQKIIEKVLSVSLILCRAKTKKAPKYGNITNAIFE